MEPCIGVRWTLGDVSERGFVALSLSVAGAVRLLGDRARYVVCVNNVPLGEVRRRLPRLPEQVELRSVDAELPPALARRLAPNMAQGVAWKFAPPRLFPDRHELALDNDCILWDLPDGLARWLERPDAFLLAEDVAPAFGRFAPWCGPEPRNTGIRGLPPGFDLVAALDRVLGRVGDRLDSELDEQGLQVAALRESGDVHIVRVDEVTVCSPFPPHRPDLGTCGAHFVGLNARVIPWSRGGRPAVAWIADHFDRHRPRVERAVAGAAAAIRNPSPGSAQG